MRCLICSQATANLIWQVWLEVFYHFLRGSTNVIIGSHPPMQLQGWRKQALRNQIGVFIFQKKKERSIHMEIQTSPARSVTRSSATPTFNVLDVGIYCPKISTFALLVMRAKSSTEHIQYMNWVRGRGWINWSNTIIDSTNKMISKKSLTIARVGVATLKYVYYLHC